MITQAEMDEYLLRNKYERVVEAFKNVHHWEHIVSGLECATWSDHAYFYQSPVSGGMVYYYDKWSIDECDRFVPRVLEPMMEEKE